MNDTETDTAMAEIDLSKLRFLGELSRRGAKNVTAAAAEAIRQETGLDIGPEDLEQPDEGGGHESEVFLSDRHVFKFVKRDRHLQRIYTNMRLLLDMEGRVDNVPQLLHAGRRYAMSMETRLPGNPLEELGNVGAAERKAVSTSLGKLIAQLAVLSLSPGFDLEAYDYWSDQTSPEFAWAAKQRFFRNRENAFDSSLSKKAAEQLFMTGYFREAVLMYWDSKGKNILFDAGSGKVSFVDFNMPGRYFIEDSVEHSVSLAYKYVEPPILEIACREEMKRHGFSMPKISWDQEDREHRTCSEFESFLDRTGVLGIDGLFASIHTAFAEIGGPEKAERPLPDLQPLPDFSKQVGAGIRRNRAVLPSSHAKMDLVG